MLQVRCYHLCLFFSRLMRSPSFTAKSFLTLLFQKAKAKEKSSSKLRIKNFKPRLHGFNFSILNKTPVSTSYKTGDNCGGQQFKIALLPLSNKMMMQVTENSSINKNTLFPKS